jgi:NAD(P)-dependent dehydrogenase (short-subunit alcohol dehydrogenase family)
MLLENKNAIIYGGGGGIGGGVARTFAREGANVFLAGRTGPPIEAVAADIKAAGGSAEVTVLDATDERAVDAHVEAVAASAGSVDVSFNLISRGDVQRTPLVDMTTDDLLRAVVTGLQSNFLTARAAARRMTGQESGVILHLNSASGAGAMPGMGSTGPADAATEALMRYLAAEVGPQGVRVLGIHQGRDEAAVAELVGRYRRELHCTATGCSPRSRRPRTWSRRPPRAPDAGVTASRAARGSGLAVSSCSRPGSGRS